MADDWTPYGLERLRVQAVRRRRIFAALAFLVLAVAWLTYSAVNTTRTFETGFAGNDGSGSAELTVPERKPLTLTVSPGRLTVPPEIVQDQEASAGPRLPARGPYAEYPVNLQFFLNLLLPLLLLAGLAYLLGRRRATSFEEVNYGIYKGAMPLEMISASYRHLVITNREAQASLFGKDRSDYVSGARLPEGTLVWTDPAASPSTEEAL